MEIVVPPEYQALYESDGPILKVPHPVLRQKAEPVAKVTKRTQEVMDSMVRIMRAANGVGLAGPQVGVSERIIVIAPEGFRPLPLVNPIILSREGTMVGQEGCLSIPGLYGDVERARKIEIEALDRKGRRVQYELEGMPARVVQHEIDHLDAVLFTDKVDPSTLHWMHPDGPEDEI